MRSVVALPYVLMQGIFRRSVLVLPVAVLLWAAAACGDGDSEGARPDTPASQPDTPAPDLPAPARPIIAPSETRSTGPAPSGGGLRLWDVAGLEKRLDLQGMAPRRQPAPARHSFLSVAGTTYLVGNAELQVFIYDDAAAADRDIAGVDTVEVAPRGQKGTWPTRATLIRNNNLIAILLGQNALQIERVQRALMAGLGPSS